MSGLRPHIPAGPSETVMTNEDIVGGTFVEPVDTTSTIKKVKKGTAGSLRILGLAIGDAAAVAGSSAETTDPWGRPVSGMLKPPNEVAIATSGSWWLKNTSGARIEWGDHIKCGANGTFVKWVEGTDSISARLAKCIDYGGVAINAEGRFRLMGLS